LFSNPLLWSRATGGTTRRWLRLFGYVVFGNRRGQKHTGSLFDAPQRLERDRKVLAREAFQEIDSNTLQHPVDLIAFVSPMAVRCSILARRSVGSSRRFPNPSACSMSASSRFSLRLRRCRRFRPDGLWHLGAPMTTEDEVRLLELQLADIKRQIAYHEGALQDLWMQLMELRARVTAARRQIMGEDGDQ
jgi:hypothetical protein